MYQLTPVTPSQVKIVGSPRGWLTGAKITVITITLSVISFFVLAGVAVVAQSRTVVTSDHAVVITGCDTEDSCAASYVHGAWVITRAHP